MAIISFQSYTDFTAELWQLDKNPNLVVRIGPKDEGYSLRHDPNLISLVRLVVLAVDTGENILTCRLPVFNIWIDRHGKISPEHIEMYEDAIATVQADLSKSGFDSRPGIITGTDHIPMMSDPHPLWLFEMLTPPPPPLPPEKPTMDFWEFVYVALKDLFRPSKINKLSN